MLDASGQAALDAARQAICTIDELKRKGSEDKDYDYWRANFRDTEAYILMQADKMGDARRIYETDLSRTETDGGALFRYAVALNATGDKAAAETKFLAAMNDREYLPTAELQLLKDYVPEPVRQMAYEMMNLAYPDPNQSRLARNKAAPSAP